MLLYRIVSNIGATPFEAPPRPYRSFYCSNNKRHKYFWAVPKLLEWFCHTCEAIASKLASYAPPPPTSYFKSVIHVV